MAKEKNVEVYSQEGELVRVYTKEEGKNPAKLAEEFAKKNGYKTREVDAE